HEFANMINLGAGPGRSAFLSAFFALIGCHGVHVSAGLLWLLTMMAQVYAKGYRADILRRLLCFALFWHTLDIIWVALFSLVYRVGVAPQGARPFMKPAATSPPAMSSPPPTSLVQFAATLS